MAQTVFDSGLNAFCRRYLVQTAGGAAPDPNDFAIEGIKQQKILFENLMLFDKISLKVKGESIPISMLIGLVGQRQFDELVEQGALEFVLWDQEIVYVVGDSPGVDALGCIKFSSPEYIDPEMSIDAGLNWMRNAPVGRKRKQLVRRLVPLVRRPGADLSDMAVKAVGESLRRGEMEQYGIARVSGTLDRLTAPQKSIAATSAEQLAEYHYLSRNRMTSFSDYRYFSPFWASLHRFRTMNRTVAGFSALSTLEGMPDLKVLFNELDEPLKKVAQIRQTRNAKQFRQWLEETAGTSPDADWVRSYLGTIGGPRRKTRSTSAKLLKSVVLASIGVGVGSAAGALAGSEVGLLAGVGATPLVVAAAEKLAEVLVDTGVGVLDTFVLDGGRHGWSPRLFFDDLAQMRNSKRTL